MPPSTAASHWSDPGASVPTGCEATRLQEAQLADWLMQGEAFSAKSPQGATEEAVILKVPSGAQPESMHAFCTVQHSRI